MAADLHVDKLRLDLVVVGSEALLRPHGELDMFSVGRLQAALDEVPAAATVTVDLADVDFVDTAVLRCLARVAEQRARAGQRLRVDNAHGIVRRLMDLLRLDDLRGV